MSCEWAVRSLVPRHRSKAALFPVAVSGVVFSTVEPLCFECVFLSGRGYYVLPRQMNCNRRFKFVAIMLFGQLNVRFHVHALISIKPLLVLSTLIRLVLVLYSEWHDRHSLVKYTDVDYLVFTDATSYTLTPGPLNHAQGPLGKWVNIGE